MDLWFYGKKNFVHISKIWNNFSKTEAKAFAARF